MVQEALENYSLSRAQVRKWHKAFKEGWEKVADNSRSGRPSTSRTDENLNRVRDGLNQDGRLGGCLIADTLSLSKSSVNRIVTKDLKMRKVCAELVPKVLKDDQNG